MESRLGRKMCTMEEIDEILRLVRVDLGMEEPSPAIQNTNETIPQPVPNLRSSRQHRSRKKRNAAKSNKDLESTKLLCDKNSSRPEGLECKTMKAIEHEQDQADILFGSIEAKSISHNLASAGLSYLRKKGRNLELVKGGFYEFGEISKGHRVHFNFQAKRADAPNAPVKTYFGQMRHYGFADFYVECCVCLGESDSLPVVRDNRGCKYCTEYVHHPVGGCKGIIWGLLRYNPEKKIFYTI